MNIVGIVGRLTRDPEITYTGGGQAVAKMRVAVDRAGDKDEGDGTYKAGFFNVTCFGKTAEICEQYLTKGRQAGFSGRLHYHEWEAQDGGKRNSTEILAQDVRLLGSRTDGEGGGGEEDTGQTTLGTQTAAADDDIPF